MKKQVVSFSGGLSSATTVIEVIEKFGSDNVAVVGMDTGAEHPGTYVFIKKFTQYIKEKYGIEITYLRGDFSLPMGKGVGYTITDVNDLKHDLKPFEEMIAKYGIPYIGGMFCTDRMKLKPYKKYCDQTFGKGNYTTWLGIRSDEPKRLGVKKDIDYLASIIEMDKEDVVSEWNAMPFTLGIDEWNGNCVYYPKKSNLKLAAAQRDNPELYFKWLEMLYSDSVRHDDKTGHWSQMYRGKQSLEQVVAMFDGSTGDEIKARIRGGKMNESGSCSESCEVFSCGI